MPPAVVLALCVTESLADGEVVPMPMLLLIAVRVLAPPDQSEAEVTKPLAPKFSSSNEERLTMAAWLPPELYWRILEPLSKRMAAEPLATMSSLAKGVVLLIPTLPLAVAKYAEPEEVIAVVEAYGNTEAVEEVAMNEEAVSLPAMKELPMTDSFQFGEVVPMPTRPFTIKPLVGPV